MRKNVPSVSLITVNYDGKKFLKRYFDSLYSLKYPAAKIEPIMVDNGSKDRSVDYVHKNYPKVKIIKNKVNNYCRANNLGIKQAKGQYVGLINNDVVLQNNWLTELIAFMDKDKTIGAVTGKILFPDGRIQGTGHFESPNFYWSDRGYAEQEKGQYNRCEEVPTISHCASLYRKDCLEEVGYLDEDFKFYMEDVDMSLRAREKGWRLFYVPKGVVYHDFHGTSSEALAKFYCERNRLLLIAKHYPQKLADELFGRGYFTFEAGQKGELIKVLPEVFNKMFKHNDHKTIMPLLPGVFDNLSKILNMEKDLLIREVDTLRNETLQKEQLLDQRNKETVSLREMVQQFNNVVSEEKKSKDGLSERAQRQEKRLEEIDAQLRESQVNIVQKDAQLENLTRQVQQLGDAQVRLQEREKDLVEKEVRLENLAGKINDQQNQLEGVNVRLREQDEIIAQRDSQLRELNGQIQDLIRQIEEQKRCLEERGASLAQKDSQLQDLTGQIQEQQRGLEEKEARLREQDERIAQKDSQLQELLGQIQDHQGWLGERDARLEELNRQIQEQQRGLEEKEARLREQDERIAQKDSQLQDLTGRVEDQQRQLGEASDRLQEQEKTLEEKNAEMENFAKQIQKQKSQLENQESVLRKYEKDIAEKKLVLENTRKQIEALLGQLKTADAQLTEAREIIVNKDTQLENRQQQNQELQADLDMKEGQLQEVSNEIDQIYNSETYRFLARPFWKVCSAVKPVMGPVKFMSKRLFKKKSKNKLCLGMFSAGSNTAILHRSNRYTVTVTNEDTRDYQGKVVIDIYSYDDLTSNKHYGYIAKHIMCPGNASIQLDIDYDWDSQAHFYLDGTDLRADDLWKGALDSRKFYKVKALLYDSQLKLIDGNEIVQKLRK